MSCASLRAPMITEDTVGALQQPVDGDLRHGLAGLGGDRVERVDHAEELRVIDRRAEIGGLVQAAAFGQRLAAA